MRGARFFRSVLAFCFVYLANFQAGAAQPAVPNLGQCGSDVTFILRQDFTDVPLLDVCADPTLKEARLRAALGAGLSYTYDDIHKSSSASVLGLAAVNFHVPAVYTPGMISEISFGPYAQGSGVYSFATPTTVAGGSDQVTTGAYVQFFLDLPHKLPFVVRLRGGELTDNTGVHDGAAIFELIPAFELVDLPSNSSFLGRAQYFIFGSPYALLNRSKSPQLVFSPEFEAQYDSYQAGPITYSIFARHSEAMRLGPLVALKLTDVGYFLGTNSAFIDEINKFAFSETYHSDRDSYSNSKYYIIQSSVIYNLTQDGNYAVTGTYSIGDSEFTGNRSRQVRAAFSAKF